MAVEGDVENKNLREQLESKVGQLNERIAECGPRIAVHPKQLDDPKKGPSCPNRRARMTYTKRLNEMVAELDELKARLAALSETFAISQPAEQPTLEQAVPPDEVSESQQDLAGTAASPSTG